MRNLREADSLKERKADSNPTHYTKIVKKYCKSRKLLIWFEISRILFYINVLMNIGLLCKGSPVAPAAVAHVCEKTPLAAARIPARVQPCQGPESHPARGIANRGIGRAI